MTTNLRNIRVLKLIVHDVPQRFVGNNAGGVIYSYAPNALDDDLRHFFQQRLAGSLEKAGCTVEPDPDADQTMPRLISDILSKPEPDFVSISQSMADHLHQSQTGANPGGLLCVIDVVSGAVPAVAILKLAREEAVRIEQQTDMQGRLFFDLEHLRNTILSNRTRVFKAGLFTVEDAAAGRIQGIVSDNQQSYVSQTEVAEFFLKTFLGCKLTESSSIITKRVLEATEGFILNRIADSEHQARYMTALYSDFGNETNTFNPVGFAQANFRLDDREPYREWLVGQGITSRQFPKNTELIESRLKKMTMGFASGIAVVYPPDALGEELRVSQIEGGRTRVVVEDELTRFQGKDR